MWKRRGDWVGKVGHDVFFGVHANCPNFVPLKRKKREIKETKKQRNKETKKGGYESISNKEKKKAKKKWEKGVDCIAAVTDRHAKSALIKGLRLQRQRAQGPALPPPKLLKHIEKKGERLHCLLWCLQETEHQRRKRENKKMLRKEKEDEVVCEDKERNEDWTSE